MLPATMLPLTATTTSSTARGLQASRWGCAPPCGKQRAVARRPPQQWQSVQHKPARGGPSIAAAAEVGELEDGLDEFESVRPGALDDDEAEGGLKLGEQPLEGGAPAPIPAGKAKLRIRMRGYEVDILKDACAQIAAIAAATGAEVKGPVHLPTRRKLYCVLRSPHVNKDSREHFEVRTHHRLVDLRNLSAGTVQAMMEWVAPAGLEVQCSVL